MKHQGQYGFFYCSVIKQSVILPLCAFSLKFSAKLMTEGSAVIGQRIGRDVFIS